VHYAGADSWTDFTARSACPTNSRAKRSTAAQSVNIVSRVASTVPTSFAIAFIAARRKKPVPTRAPVRRRARSGEAHALRADAGPARFRRLA